MVTEAGLNKELIPHFGFILKSDSKKVHFIQKVNWVRLGKVRIRLGLGLVDLTFRIHSQVRSQKVHFIQKVNSVRLPVQ